MSRDINWMLQEYGLFFQSFGIESNEVVDHFTEWKEKTGKLSVEDYVWYLFGVLLGETKKQVSSPVDYHRNLDDIYLKMLQFRVRVENQADNHLIQQIIVNRVQLWLIEMKTPFRLQAISINCCPYCEIINGQSFSPEEVLQDPYFASSHCTNSQGCSCGYIPVVTSPASTGYRVELN